LAEISDTQLVQPPQQQRSRKTMDQILDAAEVLLGEKNFDDLSINDIVEKAGCSVGAFYGRFRDKEALLHALDERYFADFIAEGEQVLTLSQWDGKSAEDIVRAVLEFLVTSYSRQRGLLRTLSLRARLRDDARFQARERQAWTLFQKLQELLLERSAEIPYSNPEIVIKFGFQTVFYSLREFILWGDMIGGISLSPEQVVSELTRIYLDYLGVPNEIQPPNRAV
jgi:AcrR family transcriptional regulator